MLTVNNNSFKTYHHKDLNCDIRAVYINDEPWFVGNEVAKILQFKNPTDAIIKQVESDNKMTVMTNAPGSNYVHRLILISFDGVTDLTMNSRMPKAREIRNWLRYDVYPSIYRTGVYEKTELDSEKVKEDPEAFVDIVIKRAAADKEYIKSLEKKINKLNRESVIAQFIADPTREYTLDIAAKIFSSAGYNMGQYKLMEFLRDTGYLLKSSRKKNTPSQQAINKGYMTMRTTIDECSQKTVRVEKYVTGKGLEKIARDYDMYAERINMKPDPDGQYRDEEGFILLKPTAAGMNSIYRMEKKKT